MGLAPIALFLYNRADHSNRTLNSLSDNLLATDSELFVFIDGPKNDHDVKEQEKISFLLKNLSIKFKSLNVFHRRENVGLAKSISSGVTSILKDFDKIIVLEDDLITSQYFLQFMNKSLDTYYNHPNVYSVNGYMHPINFGENEIFLSPLATSSWGWATWKDKWSAFSMETPGQSIIQNNEFLKNRFNIGNLPYHEYLNNKTSWAIRWYYSVFIRGGLGVFPTQTFVQNIGFDGSGTNCGNSLLSNQNFAEGLPDIVRLDTINLKYEAMLQNHFRVKSTSGVRAVVKKIKSAIKAIIK